ncbi:MAG: hypothetical protein ACLRT4_13845 [Thomasclavelia sp.]
MIDPKDYPFHVKWLGGVEEFEEYIRLWKEATPWMSESRIKEILDGEEQAKVSMSMWSNPFMP